MYATNKYRTMFQVPGTLPNLPRQHVRRTWKAKIPFRQSGSCSRWRKAIERILPHQLSWKFVWRCESHHLQDTAHACCFFLVRLDVRICICHNDYDDSIRSMLRPWVVGKIWITLKVWIVWVGLCKMQLPTIICGAQVLFILRCMTKAVLFLPQNKTFIQRKLNSNIKLFRLNLFVWNEIKSPLMISLVPELVHYKRKYGNRVYNI